MNKVFSKTFFLNLAGAGFFLAILVGSPVKVLAYTGNWSTTTALPVARDLHSSIVNNGYVYAIAGENSVFVVTSSVLYAQINSTGSLGAWTNTTALPAGRDDQTSIVNNGYAYVIGGWVTATTSSVLFAQINSTGSLGAWTNTTALPASGRSRHTSIVNNGYVYAIGGRDASSTATSSVVYAQINATGSLGAWVTTTALPAGRYKHTSIVNNGYVYAIGGQDSAGVNTSSVVYAQINATGSLGAWVTTTAMPAGRNGHSSIVDNGYVYTIGGFSVGVTTSSVVYAQINATGSLGAWVTTTAMPAGRTWHRSINSNGYVYAIAGDDSGAAATSSVVYAPLNLELPTVTAISPSSATNTAPVSIASITGTNFALGWDKENGLVGNWRLDENATNTPVIDSSGYSNNGTSTGTTVVAGKIGNARSFDGVSDYINVGNQAVHNVTNITVSAWVVSDVTTPLLRIASREESINKNWSLMHGAVASTYRFGVVVSGTEYIAASGTGFSTGVWHHVVGTYDGETVRLYVDGVETANNTTPSGNLDTNPIELRIGNSLLPSTFWNGTIDEVRIYNHALSPSEISQLYNATIDPVTKLSKSGQSDITGTGFTLSTSTSLTNGSFDITGAATGAWNVVLTNPDNTSGTLTNGFTVTAAPPTPPGTPTYTSIGTNTLTLNWASSVNADYYKVERGTNGNTFAQISTTTALGYDDSALSANLTYWYRVRGNNSSGDSLYSASSSVLTDPGQAGTPTYTNIASSTLTVNWTAPTGGASSTKIERATNGNGPFNQIATTTTLFYNDSGLATSTTYYYRVRSTNASGDGPWSNTTALPVARQNFSSIVNNGYVYAIGGRDSATTVTSSVVYAPINSTGSLGSWLNTTALPAAMRSHSSIVNNDYVYTIGGAIDSAGTATSSVVYTLVNTTGSLGSWLNTTALPAARYYHSSIVNNGYAYAIGGAFDSTGVPTSSVIYALLNSGGDGSYSASSSVTTTSGTSDASPPTPNPMTFSSTPAAASTSSISMTSTVGSDATTPVNYLFTFTSCTSNGGTGGASSSWQSGTSYTNTGLQINKCYAYNVTARDSVSPTPNIGTASASSSAYTLANVPGAPTLSGATTSTLNFTNAENSNPASSPTTNFAVFTSSTSPNDPKWQGFWVNSSGVTSSVEVWMSDATLDALVLNKLSTSTTYTFKVKARNNDTSPQETPLGTAGSGVTNSGVSNNPPSVPTQDAPINATQNNLTLPVFKMTATDPDSDNLQYKVAVYSASNCGSGNIFTADQSSSQTGWSGQNASSSAMYTSGMQGTYTTQSALAQNTTYYWKASAKDTNGSNTWTDSTTCNSFTTTSGLWTTDSGSWSISANQLAITPSSASTTQLHVTSQSQTNGVIEFKAKSSAVGANTGNIGGIARADGGTNRYQLAEADVLNNKEKIGKRITNAYTNLTSSTFTFSADTFYEFRGYINGISPATLQSWINGATAISTTDSALGSAGFLGLEASSTNGSATFTYDNFAFYTSPTITFNNLPSGGSWAVRNHAGTIISTCLIANTWGTSTSTGQIPVDYDNSGGSVAVWTANSTCSGAPAVTYPSSGWATDIFGGDTYAYSTSTVPNSGPVVATSTITVSASGLISF